MPVAHRTYSCRVPNPRRLRRFAAAAALPVVLVLSGCGVLDPGPTPTAPEPAPSTPTAPSSEDTTSSTAAELDRFYEQDVDWERCRSELFCATIEVPLDYGKPAQASIDLSLLKVPAGGKAVGSLLVNPGGPGGSGVEYAANASSYFGEELLRSFDIIGFDPRGVGRSTPVECLSDRELDAFIASDPDPDTHAERRETVELLEGFGRGCVEESGELAAHMSTAEAARDMDIVRGVVGDRKLRYFGASYGTFLGATYADLFPKRVGRMVLDGAIDPSLSTKQMSLVQAKGFEVALRAYVAHCVERGDCFLGGTVDEGTERIRTFLDGIEGEPIAGSGERVLTIGTAVLGIWAPLYNEAWWQYLDTGLQRAFDGDGSVLLALADSYTSRGPDGYTDNSVEALYAVNCLDHDDAIPVSEVPSQVPEFEEVSPTFGAIFAYGLASCSQWPIHTGRVPAPIHAEGAAPILVVGTTRDPATPLTWARALADQLESGVLVTRDGDGHTGYNAGNPCVDRVVESYLVAGTVPDGPVDC